MLPPRREHDFHKITVFTFSSNFDPKWDPKSKDFHQKRARGDPKITKMAEKSGFSVDPNLSSNFGRKKTQKTGKRNPQVDETGRNWLQVLHSRGDRWEGKGGQDPPRCDQVWTRVPETPATGAADLKRSARPPPLQLMGRASKGKNRRRNTH